MRDQDVLFISGSDDLERNMEFLYPFAVPFDGIVTIKEIQRNEWETGA